MSADSESSAPRNWSHWHRDTVPQEKDSLSGPKPPNKFLLSHPLMFFQRHPKKHLPGAASEATEKRLVSTTKLFSNPSDNPYKTGLKMCSKTSQADNFESASAGPYGPETGETTWLLLSIPILRR
jgi:hypothetical protein